MNTAKNVIFPWTLALGSQDTDKDKDKENQSGGATNGNAAVSMFFGIIAIILGIYAGWLCWKCNEREDMGLRVIYTGIAFANAIPYLIYYFFIRYLFGFECKCCA
jgi:hypothetical protein